MAKTFYVNRECRDAHVHRSLSDVFQVVLGGRDSVSVLEGADNVRPLLERRQAMFACQEPIRSSGQT